MRPPLIQRSRRSIPHRSRERGVTMALVALAIVGVIAMAGLSIDVGTLYQASAEAQRAADAGALAAARTISMQGLTGDPGNISASWQQVCGGPNSPASLAAGTVVMQNPLSSASTNPTVTVNYSFAGTGSSTDCSSLVGTGFGVNPQVTVSVQQANLPTYFSKIWGRTGNTVGATATAEVFNSSNSNTYSSSSEVVPVQPRCVKPWMVPNYDPSGNTCTGTTSFCKPFVTTTTSVLGNPGIENGNVIGERFWLLADCNPGTPGTCSLLTQPQANYTVAQGAAQAPPNLEYVPGQTSFQSIAIPSDGSAACSAVSGNYAQAIAGGDQSTQYQCGVQSSSATNPNQVNLAENPVATGDTTNGVECLTRQTVPYSPGASPSGQDTLAPYSQQPTYPFQIQAGSSNPLLSATPPVPSNGIITASNSIVSLPIYDSNQTTTFGAGTTTPVTIIGFLQVFINVVDGNGNVYVTVLNVSGCGNGLTAIVSPPPPIYGTSPVPIRLITPTPAN
jgi:putative Flp pilus-assembly TadE/G-like protein